MVKRRRSDLQCLRGVSVLAVVAFHAYGSFFTNGYIGVDVFFVLSGFVVFPRLLEIFANSGEERGSLLARFYLNRYLRLAPVLYVTLVATIILVFVGGEAQDFAGTIAQSFYSILLSGNYGVFNNIGNYFTPNLQPLTHTWSLAVEEQFYLLTPLLLFSFKARLGGKAFRKLLLILISCSVVIFILPDVLSIFQPKLNSITFREIVFYSPISRGWEFMIGSYLSMVKHRRSKVESKFLYKGLLIFLIVILFFPLPLGHTFGALFGSLLGGGVILFSEPDQLPQFVQYILEKIGDRSYSIYLVHMPLIYMAKYSPLLGYGNDRIVYTILAVFFSLACGHFLWLLVENRFRVPALSYNTYSYKPKMYLFTTLCLITILVFVSFTPKYYSGGNMSRDRLTEGRCNFWTDSMSNVDTQRFHNCAKTYGKGIIVLGDSHAMNIYNSLVYSKAFPFLMGITKPGCRPNDLTDSCDYMRTLEFIKVNKSTVNLVIFHQSGSYLLQDENSIFDSSQIFKSGEQFTVSEPRILGVANYLNVLSRFSNVIWLGPFAEARINATPLEVGLTNRKLNSNSIRIFNILEKRIDDVLKSSFMDFRYVPLSGKLYSTWYLRNENGCVQFRDKDHWSLCGEKHFASGLAKIVSANI